MDLVAVIECDPAITLDRWQEVVIDHESLVVAPPREGLSPFTGAPTVFRAAAGACQVVIDGEVAGSIVPSGDFADDRKLLVSASDRDEHWVEELVEAISAEVGGSVEWLGG